MKIQSTAKYKSIDPIQPPLSLSDFVVLSGLNGSGKSQLLLAIREEIIQIIDSEVLNPVKFVDHNTLAPNGSLIVSTESLKIESQAILTTFTNYRYSKKNNPNTELSYYFRDFRQMRLLEKIAQRAGKDVDTLNDEDFFNHYPVNDGLPSTDIFYHNFSTLFKRYHDKWNRNQFNRFKNQQGGFREISFLSDEEFIAEEGEEPWLLVNQMALLHKSKWNLSSTMHLIAPAHTA